MSGSDPLERQKLSDLFSRLAFHIRRFSHVADADMPVIIMVMQQRSFYVMSRDTQLSSDQLRAASLIGRNAVT